MLRAALPTIVLLAASPAFAGYHPSLTSDSQARACVGPADCTVSDNHALDPATHIDSLPSTAQSLAGDGSYAHAHATASFGAEHVYADAFRSEDTGQGYGDAAARAYAQFYDYASSGQIVGNNFNFQFAVSGFATPTDHVFGAAAYAYLYFLIVDTVSGAYLDYGSYPTSDTNPAFTVNRNVYVPTGDGVYLRVEFEADVRTTNNDYDFSGNSIVNGVLPVVADYSNTLHVFIDPLDEGGSIGFASGHDYATPSVSGAPEPGVWALMLGGFGLAGTTLRRRRPTTA